MARSTSQYVCSNCGNISPKWVGKCSQCNEWNTFEEKTVSTPGKGAGVGTKTKTQATVTTAATRIRDIKDGAGVTHKPTGIGELDRVLGGGLVPGAAVVLAGEPGAGKSTMLGTVAAKLSETVDVLYISGEESVQQIALRAKRIKAVGENLFLAAENDLSKAVAQVNEVNPGLLIVDSMQTIASPDIDSRAGSPGQVTEVATVFTRLAKERSIPLLMIGHFTKEGTMAGPRTVEHLVDVVLSLEGDEDTPLRFLRALKNRYGSSEEIGCFEHGEEGLLEVPDPSGFLLGDREKDVAGVCTSIFQEGRRAFPIEVQALVASTGSPNPRRVASGLDFARTTMINAVIDRRTPVRLGDKDIYVSTVGGVKIKETAVDLATVVAVVSSAKDIPVWRNAIAVGEVSLTGEIRQVQGILRRVTEAARLGFTLFLVPKGTRDLLGAKAKGLTIIEVSVVRDVVDVLTAKGE